jgi:LytS/YehU family sensor histidine kinase
VRAKNMAGTFSSPIEFTLNINRPFWATWWFILLALSAVTYAIVYIVRTRIALALTKKEKEHANKVRFLKSEYKALNALMNPHFIFNALNSVNRPNQKNGHHACEILKYG